VNFDAGRNEFSPNLGSQEWIWLSKLNSESDSSVHGFVKIKGTIGCHNLNGRYEWNVLQEGGKCSLSYDEAVVSFNLSEKQIETSVNALIS